MTALYYTDAAGAPQTANLAIIANGINCAGDILGNMDITGSGTGIYRTPEDEDKCPTDTQRAALAAGATWYAEDADSAAWWVDYVAGYNATNSDLDALREELADMTDDDLCAIAKEVGANDRTIAQGYPVQAITDWLCADAVDYENERGAFEGNLETLRGVMAARAA